MIETSQTYYHEVQLTCCDLTAFQPLRVSQSGTSKLKYPLNLQRIDKSGEPRKGVTLPGHTSIYTVRTLHTYTYPSSKYKSLDLLS